MTDELNELFAERHCYLIWSLGELKRLPSGPARFACFSDLTSVLTAHLSTVERATKPALRRLGASKQLDAGLVVYAIVTRALAETFVSLRTSEGFAASVRSLAAAVESMCRLERDFVLPTLDVFLGANERIDLELDMQALFEEHVGVVGIDLASARRVPDKAATFIAEHG